MQQNNTKILKNLPPKGTADWFPNEFEIRKYIFDTFRKVCTSFGYQEYLTPTFEKADIYKAKSGEDIGGKELMLFKDKAERELALRPEMTPSVIRMITRTYNNQPKPMRYFSIANFFRNEKPQKGRNREFWQLNYDIFGSKSIYADIEILKIALEIMFAFLPKEKLQDDSYKPFVVYINDRKVLNNFLEKTVGINEKDISSLVRILDKKEKISKKEFDSKLKQLNLNKEQIDKIDEYMQKELTVDSLGNEEVTKDLKKVFEVLNAEGYSKWIKFKPNLIRGFDYYNGIVYEVFDTNKDNPRSLFGGGRYDGLGKIFGDYNIPATGCAPGDETMKLFLQNWDLLKNISKKEMETIYIPIIDINAIDMINKLSKKLRNQGKIVLQGLERQAISKSLEFANKMKMDKVIIIGSNEIAKRQYIEKDMLSGKQIVRNL